MDDKENGAGRIGVGGDVYQPFIRPDLSTEEIEELYKAFSDPRCRTAPTAPYIPPLANDITIQKISRLKLEKDEVLILWVAQDTTQEELKHIHASIKNAFPDNKCLVMGENSTLEIVAKKPSKEKLDEI